MLQRLPKGSNCQYWSNNNFGGVAKTDTHNLGEHKPDKCNTKMKANHICINGWQLQEWHLINAWSSMMWILIADVHLSMVQLSMIVTRHENNFIIVLGQTVCSYCKLTNKVVVVLCRYNSSAGEQLLNKHQIGSCLWLAQQQTIVRERENWWLLRRYISDEGQGSSWQNVNGDAFQSIAYKQMNVKVQILRFGTQK